MSISRPEGRRDARPLGRAVWATSGESRASLCRVWGSWGRECDLDHPTGFGLIDIIPHAACLSAFLSLLKPHWSEQRRMAHGPCPGNGTPGGARWIPGQLSSCSPEYSGARLPGFEFWLPPCLSCVTLGELFNLSVPVFPAAK